MHLAVSTFDVGSESPALEKHHKILLVEDDPDIREVFSAVLEDFGYQIASAEDGPQAQALLGRGEPPQVIILDMCLRGMSGERLLSELRRNSRLTQIPVLLFTALPWDEEQARRIGADGIVNKPVDLESLLATLQKFCLDSGPAVTNSVTSPLGTAM